MRAPVVGPEDTSATLFPLCDSMEKSDGNCSEKDGKTRLKSPIYSLQNVQAINPLNHRAVERFLLPSSPSLRLAPSQLDHPYPASLTARVVELTDGEESVGWVGGGYEEERREKDRVREKKEKERNCKEKKERIEFELVSKLVNKLIDKDNEEYEDIVVNMTINKIVTSGVRRIQELKRTGKTSVKNRTSRSDKGVPRYTHRDMDTLRWVAEQGTVRFDHLRLLLSMKAERAETQQLGKVSISVARGVVDRWERYGVAKCEKILGAEEPYIWLTPKGLRVLGLKEGEVVYRNWTPPAGKLAHYHWVNVVRLYQEARYEDKIEWVSERTIRNQRKQKTGHVIDARMIVVASQKRVAIEVEISPKGDDDVLAVIYKTLNEEKPDSIWYFTTPNTYNVVSSARSRLSESEKQKVSIELVTKLLEKEPLSRLRDEM